MWSFVFKISCALSTGYEFHIVHSVGLGVERWGSDEFVSYLVVEKPLFSFLSRTRIFLSSFNAYSPSYFGIITFAGLGGSFFKICFTGGLIVTRDLGSNAPSNVDLRKLSLLSLA